VRASPDPTHNLDLIDAIRAEIDTTSSGSIPFARLMELALYHPQHGYYLSGSNRTGRAGDFFTSVNVGDCFGMLLAAHAAEAPGHTIIEQGANDAQLAIDILRHSPTETRYIIIEPSATNRQIQKENLSTAGYTSQIQILPALSDITQPVDGIFLSNELLDAFPVHRIRYDGIRWEEIHVNRDFTETLHSIQNQQLTTATLEIPTDLPAGYTTEINLAADHWITQAAKVLKSGLITIIDYGHTSDAYYAPSRITGTLRCYHNHQAHEDPYAAIGHTDITAHLNFTRLKNAAEKEGLSIQNFTDQHRFTIRQATPWLRSIEGKTDADTKKRIRQFQTLTHPGIMGSHFHFLTLGKNHSIAATRK
jgi:SAM-dependent MidA family methyltransferase